MTLPAWPSSVPHRPRRNEWRMPEAYRQPLATEMEGGNTRLRRRAGDNVAKLEFSLRLTEAEHSDFWTFVKTTLSGGTARFTMPVYLTTSSPSTKTVQFVQPPSSSMQGRKYMVSINILVFDA